MVYPPSGPFQHAIKKIPLMKVAYRIGLFIRNFMEPDDTITISSVLKRQNEIFDDFSFSETFEIIILLFMLSRYDYLEHINRDEGYFPTDKLYDDFPLLEEWRHEYTQYDDLLDQLNIENRYLEIIFRRNTWFVKGKFVSLDLSDLFITKLEENTFTAFPQLTEVHLRNNLLGTLPSGIFRPLPKLEKVDLSFNLISKLPIHLFSDNYQLKQIDLACNGVDHRWLSKFRTLNRLSHGHLQIKI